MNSDKFFPQLIVLGTPAEEFGGGKIRLIELGAFDKVDAALMVHPTNQNMAHISCAACIDVSFMYIKFLLVLL